MAGRRSAQHFMGGPAESAVRSLMTDSSAEQAGTRSALSRRRAYKIAVTGPRAGLVQKGDFSSRLHIML